MIRIIIANLFVPASPVAKWYCRCCAVLCAHQECLELFLGVLSAYYPDTYSVVGEADERIVTITFPDGDNTVYVVADFAACPLELCGRLVQVGRSGLPDRRLLKTGHRTG